MATNDPYKVGITKAWLQRQCLDSGLSVRIDHLYQAFLDSNSWWTTASVSPSEFEGIVDACKGLRKYRLRGRVIVSGIAPRPAERRSAA